MASGRACARRVVCAIPLIVAAACGAHLPVQQTPPPEGSYDAAVYHVRFGDTSEQVQGAAVSAAFFEEPRLAPIMGRVFVESEYATSPPRVALIGHALWHRRLALDSGVIGREIEVDGAPVVVVGVLPAGFSFPDDANLWVPRVAPALRER